LPILEANGFVVKLDKYVFEEVCKFIKESTARGDKVVPISVNASYVTATQNGFLEYYIHTKNKYNIADGFLTIEFTEALPLKTTIN
jgi:EAL domain-containing protein (putative c-di-GMP-specific phosphodiesterase class I)